MGGYGSNRWGNTRTRQYIGACLQLDMRTIRPHLTLRRRSLIWRWALAGGGEATMGMATGRDAVTLSYTTQRRDAAPAAIRDEIAVEWTACTYGGERAWFRCPGCDRRARVLYLPPGGERFRCRHCHALAYGSQQVAPDERHLMQIRKIQRRLGGDAGRSFPWSLPDRPKGMHERTYERLCGALLRHEREREAILGVQMERVLARSDKLFARMRGSNAVPGPD